jgi:hypothetical protein
MRRVVAESNYGLHSGDGPSSTPTNSPLGQQGGATLPEREVANASQYLYPSGITLDFVASLVVNSGHLKFYRVSQPGNSCSQGHASREKQHTLQTSRLGGLNHESHHAGYELVNSKGRAQDVEVCQTLYMQTARSPQLK